MHAKPPKKPSLFSWMLFGAGPGPGEASYAWRKQHAAGEQAKLAIKCDMCSGIEGGPACVRACPTGAAIRVAPEKFLKFTKLAEDAV
jgi:Fe-S-cluster-containing hydrogenase component 2